MSVPQVVRQDRPSDDFAAVDRTLVDCTQRGIQHSLWRRPGLSSRDRTLTSVAALVARDQVDALPNYVNKALDSGVRPAEVCELIIQAALHSERAYAFRAVVIVQDTFAERGLCQDHIIGAEPTFLLEEVFPADKCRQDRAQNVRGLIFRRPTRTTDGPPDHELRRQPALTPRDRTLVTLSTLIAVGNAGSLPPYLSHAVAHGISQDEISEMLTHLALYAGCSAVFGCVVTVVSFFEDRGLSNAPGSPTADGGPSLDSCEFNTMGRD